MRWYVGGGSYTSGMTPDELAAAGLRYAVDGAVATITLDRPEVRNAQTPTMWRALAAIGREIPDEVRVVVVRGAGKSFSAGLDTRDARPGRRVTVASRSSRLLALSDDEMSATIDEYQQGFTFLRDPRFVSVAVVQGYAIGAGFQLALACDLRVVADDAQFCMKESALGPGARPDGNKTPGRGGWLRKGAGDLRDRPHGGCRRSGRHRACDGRRTSGRPGRHRDDLVAALTEPLAGAVRETKALLLAASSRSLDEQRRFEREAQVRRFRELAGLLAGQG